MLEDDVGKLTPSHPFKLDCLCTATGKRIKHIVYSLKFTLFDKYVYLFMSSGTCRSVFWRLWSSLRFSDKSSSVSNASANKRLICKFCNHLSQKCKNNCKLYITQFFMAVLYRRLRMQLYDNFCIIVTCFK